MLFFLEGGDKIVSIMVKIFFFGLLKGDGVNCYFMYCNDLHKYLTIPIYSLCNWLFERRITWNNVTWDFMKS